MVVNKTVDKELPVFVIKRLRVFKPFRDLSIINGDEISENPAERDNLELWLRVLKHRLNNPHSRVAVGSITY